MTIPVRLTNQLVDDKDYHLMKLREILKAVRPPGGTVRAQVMNDIRYNCDETPFHDKWWAVY